ncbi:MAG: carbohydrate ABC transporter permease [Acidimicrobiales bacterium]
MSLARLQVRTVATSRRRQLVAVYGVSLVGCVAVLVPLLWMVSTALKTDKAVFSVPPQILPRSPTLSNLGTATRLIPFWRYATNSTVVAGLGSIGTVASAALVAYPLARLRAPGLGVAFVLVLATMLLPQQVLLITQFLIFKRLGWYGTYLPLIVPSFLGGGAFNIFLLRQFFLTLSPELDQAALLDGAGYWRIFWCIIVPQSVPALVAVGILDFVSKWNDFLGPLIYLNRTSTYTLPLGLASFRDVYDTAWNYLMVDTLLAVIPCVVLFFVAQRLLVRGLVVRGTKG